jgi:serine-type D-Ala-D-Ala carboxypeptidase (penicillin-binding protein 5/6)
MKSRFKLPLIMAGLSVSALGAASGGQGPAYQSSAPIAYLIDLSTGATLYEREADKRIPPASMAKMMTAHVVFDLVQKGKLKLDQKLSVRPQTWQKWHGPEAGSTMFLRSGEQVSVENLLKGVITLSGNDACVVLAEGIAGTEAGFVALMNEKARELGMVNTNFGTSNGWPDGGATYSTARDLGKLGAATIQRHEIFYKKFYGLKEFSWGETVKGGAITQPNRNPILGKIAGADGIKTGHTEEAGFGFAGSALQNGRRLVMVVAGLPSFNARITESVNFMDWGFKAWATKPIFPAAKHLDDAEVQLGSQSRVGLATSGAVAALFPAGTALKVTSMKIVYDGPIKAPIKKGQHIADLLVQTPDLPVQRLPLVAEEDVAEAGFFRRAWLGFLSIFGF